MEEQGKDGAVSAQQIIQEVKQDPNIPDKTKNQIIEGVMSITAFSGPLPPPEMLAEYDKVFPGAAKQIFSMAEAQSNHRMAIEKKVVSSATVDSKLGIAAGLIVSLALIAASVLIIMTGHTLTGFTVMVGTIAGIVYSFKSEMVEGKAELDEKDKHVRKV